MLEPFTALAFLAAVTKTLRLGTGICLLPQRNPVYTAKEAANVDFLSGGRLDLGIGVGWLAEEFRAVNVPFERRGARCRSYVKVMRSLWCDAVSEYKDEFYELPACRMYPKPVQQPHPPLHFGGETEAALRRVADLGQGWYGFNRDPREAREGISQLEKLLAKRGRKRSDVTVSISPYLKPLAEGDIARYRDAGVDQVILLAFAGDREGLLRTLDLHATRIAEAGR
jgi:probable F420-dependent oxidoreductase